MRLADFIDHNVEPILLQWDAFARSILPGKVLGSLALRDHAEEILSATVKDIRSLSSGGKFVTAPPIVSGVPVNAAMDEASELHAIGRLGSGFDLMEVVSEYHALRSSVLRLWHESGAASRTTDVDDVSRFNESIDRSLSKAVCSFTRRVDQSRDLFLAILGHDLRNPLNSIAMSAQILPMLYSAAPDANLAVDQIATNAKVMARMISDLLDYTRTRLGAGMPVNPAPMDLQALCEQLISEFSSANPERSILMQSSGDLRGIWDSDRLRQAVSNLLGNAVQHSPATAIVTMTLRGSESKVTVRIHNGGSTIPADELLRIFDPLVRGSNSGQPATNRPGSIGLGLYIAREIAASHGGSIDVASDAEGTAFTINLPRDIQSGVNRPILTEDRIQTM